MMQRLCLGTAVAVLLAGVLAAPARAQDDVDALKKKIAELEKKIKQLEAENAALKKKSGPSIGKNQGEVTKVDGDKVSINLGSDKGAKADMYFMVRTKKTPGIAYVKIAEAKEGESIGEVMPDAKGNKRELSAGDVALLLGAGFKLPGVKTPPPPKSVSLNGTVTKVDNKTISLTIDGEAKIKKNDTIVIASKEKGFGFIQVKVSEVKDKEITGEIQKSVGKAPKLESGMEVIIRTAGTPPAATSAETTGRVPAVPVKKE
jgi:hypothetical protein